jgi:DNA polymerase-4
MHLDADDFSRRIIHVDMDAFYASVEQRDDPALRGKALAVGGAGPRGVVMTASYEARVFGVRSAMPSATARRLCPDLLFVKPRFDAYKTVSAQIRGIFLSHTPLVEPLSLDEAYLDVSDAGRPATEIAKDIRAAIRSETGLTASAGVSYNKLLAKLASDYRKPDGLTVITPEKGPAFVASLPVKKLHGIGPKTAAKMARLGIETGADLAARDLGFLEANFGSAGRYYFRAARGLCDRRVSPDRERKSVGSETTFSEDLSDYDALAAELLPQIESVERYLERSGARGRTVTVKAKYADFRIATRSRTLPEAVGGGEPFRRTALDLLASLLPPERGIRLIGVQMSNFERADDSRPPPQFRLAI